LCADKDNNAYVKYNFSRKCFVSAEAKERLLLFVRENRALTIKVLYVYVFVSVCILFIVHMLDLSCTKRDVLVCYMYNICSD